MAGRHVSAKIVPLVSDAKLMTGIEATFAMVSFLMNVAQFTLPFCFVRVGWFVFLMVLAGWLCMHTALMLQEALVALTKEGIRFPAACLIAEYSDLAAVAVGPVFAAWAQLFGRRLVALAELAAYGSNCTINLGLPARTEESSTSSFELVDLSLLPKLTLHPPPPSRLTPCRPQVRSLFSPPSPGSPSQVVRSVLSSPLRVPEYPLPGLASPTAVRSFSAYKAIVGELRRGGSVSHGFPSEAEARLYFAGAGQVTLLEFTWPWPRGGTEALQSGMENEAPEGALIVDLSADLAAALDTPDLTAFGEARSGYQTAVEDVVPAQTRQAALQELVRGVAKQLAALLPPAAGSNTPSQTTSTEDPPKPVPTSWPSQLTIDQANIDQGDMTLAWLLSLQPDPPASLYQEGPERGQCPKEAGLASQTAPARQAPERGRDSFEEAAEGCRLGSKAGRRSQAVLRDGQKLHAQHPVEGSELRPGSEFSFRLFASSLVRRVLKSGTGFAHFVSTALPLHRDGSLPVATALFPLPLPSGFASGRSRKRRRTLAQHVSVVVAIVVLALNFLHSEGKLVPPEALRRPPSAVQSSALCRLKELVKACARLGGSELQPGRKGLQLAAWHAEELRPYRDIDPDRVALSGRGSWDIAEHLHPSLLLPFLEPKTLQTFVSPPAPGPSFSGDKAHQVMGLLRKWELLRLVPGPLEETTLIRVFGSYKDPCRGRQMGDRCHMNNREARFTDGPSRRLPAGYQLVRLSCPRWSHSLYGSCVDRKDFYHQAAVTSTNAVAPVFRLRHFLGTQALASFLASADSAYLAACEPPGPFRPSSVLVSSELKVHGAFKSLFQGDHAGFEFACSGHEGLLRAAGVLGDLSERRLLNRCPVSVRGPWTGLVIDDLFCISCEALRPGPSGPLVSSSEELLRKAKQAYAREHVEGSDSKDIFSQRVFTVAGAQVDSSSPAVRSGNCLVGLPAHRRLTLAHASLAVASGRHISEELGSVLSGCWATALLYRRCLMTAIGPLFSVGKKTPDAGGSYLQPLGPWHSLQAGCCRALVAVLGPKGVVLQASGDHEDFEEVVPGPPLSCLKASPQAL
ncbi:hypothetical protein AK812_SmicGene42187 [Symbiodinium microadriaticum]|uniref:Uncharacterized protein n=1 Tax=Symbiodinium microadriaticum TaxID=2951 RepID=A0A1Q9C474_SYMMI|nr:hypothetical protein AK812_SmicGene42187 [Symbiodinium microadriaticum]